MENYVYGIKYANIRQILIQCKINPNNRFTGYNKDHNDSYEYFKPFDGIMVTNALFAPLNIVQKIFNCFLKYSPPGIVKQIIIGTSFSGSIKVFYQIIDIQ